MRDGASEGIRTLDTHVGNVMLYQAELRSLPMKRLKIYGNPPKLQALFFHTLVRSFAPPLGSRHECEFQNLLLDSGAAPE